MKNLIVLVWAVFIFSCQPAQKQRYFTESAEIDLAREQIKNYVNGDFESMVALYADTAKIFHNSTESVDAKTLTEGMLTQLAEISNYDFDDPIFEMIIDAEEETWVLFWGDWRGNLKANNQEVIVPVHVVYRFIDGKIVSEYAYYDNLPLANALAEIAKAEEESGEDEEEE